MKRFLWGIAFVVVMFVMFTTIKYIQNQQCGLLYDLVDTRLSGGERLMLPTELPIGCVQIFSRKY